MPRRLAPTLALALALPVAAAAAEPRVLDHPRAEAGRRVAVVVEVPTANGPHAETYVWLLERLDGGLVHRGVVLVGLGAIVDRIDLGEQSLDVTYRDHYPVDSPGRPRRRAVRGFPLSTAVTTPAWAETATLTRPEWAAPADLPRR